VSLSQGSDTESALQAKHYLEGSIEATPKGKYPALYVDVCEDLARTHFLLGKRKEAEGYLRQAERAIPEGEVVQEAVEGGVAAATKSAQHESTLVHEPLCGWRSFQMSHLSSRTIPDRPSDCKRLYSHAHLDQVLTPI